MPTYQYACTACGSPLEAQQSFSDEPLTECPECGGRLRKVFSAVGVVFKGSGFYRTDSRAAPSNGDSANGDGAKSDTSSEGAKSDSSKTTSESGSKSSTKAKDSSKAGSTAKAGSAA